MLRSPWHDKGRLKPSTTQPLVILTEWKDLCTHAHHISKDRTIAAPDPAKSLPQCILSHAMRTQALTAAFLLALSSALFAQQPSTAKPEDTEVWQPEPKVVTPGATCAAAPSDAIILFD